MTLKNDKSLEWMMDTDYEFSTAPEAVYLVATSTLTFRSGESLTSPVLFTLEEGSILVKIPEDFESDVITEEEKLYQSGSKVLYAECALFASDYIGTIPGEEEDLEPIMFYNPGNVSGKVQVLDYREIEYDVPQLFGETLIRGNIAPRLTCLKLEKLQQEVKRGEITLVLVFSDKTILSKSWRETIDIGSAVRFTLDYYEVRMKDLELIEIKILRHAEDV